MTKSDIKSSSEGLPSSLSWAHTGSKLFWTENFRHKEQVPWEDFANAFQNDFGTQDPGQLSILRQALVNDEDTVTVTKYIKFSSRDGAYGSFIALLPPAGRRVPSAEESKVSRRVSSPPETQPIETAPNGRADPIDARHAPAPGPITPASPTRLSNLQRGDKPITSQGSLGSDHSSLLPSAEDLFARVTGDRFAQGPKSPARDPKVTLPVASDDEAPRASIERADPVTLFLNNINLSSYSDTFKKEELTELPLLKLMNDKDLSKLGMKRVGQRKRFLLAASQIRTEPAPVVRVKVRTPEQHVNHIIAVPSDKTIRELKWDLSLMPFCDMSATLFVVTDTDGNKYLDRSVVGEVLKNDDCLLLKKIPGQESPYALLPRSSGTDESPDNGPNTQGQTSSSTGVRSVHSVQPPVRSISPNPIQAAGQRRTPSLPWGYRSSSPLNSRTGPLSLGPARRGPPGRRW